MATETKETVGTFEQWRTPAPSFEEWRSDSAPEAQPIDTVDDLPEEQQNELDNILSVFDSPEQIKMKMDNALYYSQHFAMPVDIAYSFEPVLNKMAFGTEKLSAQPSKLFMQALSQSLAEKPAMMLRGTEVYTPGKAAGLDPLLDKAATFLESRNDPMLTEKLRKVAAGKLWPIGEDKKWWQVEKKYLPEVVNAWAVNVGDQIPIMLTMLAGQAVGKVAGTQVGAGVGVVAAMVTGGPDPTDVVTAPAVAALTQKLMGHIGGASGLVAIEAAGYMDAARSYGIHKDIAEENARLYGLGSGLIEYSQWMFRFLPYKQLGKGGAHRVLKAGLLHIGGTAFEGVEEISQEGLQRHLLRRAVKQMQVRDPSFTADIPATFEGWKRTGAIAVGVSAIVKLPAAGLTLAEARKQRAEQVLPKEMTEQAAKAKLAPEVKTVAEAPEIQIKQGIKAVEYIKSVIEGDQYADLSQEERTEAGLKMLVEVGGEVWEGLAELTPEAVRQHIEAKLAPAEAKQPWEMKASGKEYAAMPVDEVDRAAFGFARKDIKTLLPKELSIKWQEDYKSAVEQQEQSGLSKKEWAESIDLSEPIDVIFEDGKFKVDDGYHRYHAATILGKPLNVDLTIKDKPHKAIIKKALSEGKAVPRQVLEEYKSEKWAQEALAKPAQVSEKKATEPTTLKEDVTGILGGLPAKPLGFTKDEMEHLGVRGRSALRGAQERGLKVGYKQGGAATVLDARRAMANFVIKKKLELKNRIDALNIVKTYVPKAEQARYMRRVVNVKTEKNIEKLYTQIMDFLEKADQRQAVRDFKAFIKKAKKDYKAGQATFGKLRKSVRDDFVKVLDEFDLAKVSEDKAKELESRLKFIKRIAGEAEKVFTEFNDDYEFNAGLEGNVTDYLVMGQRRIDETNRLSKTPLKELTAQDIRQMQGLLQHLLEVNNKKKDSKARWHAENLSRDIIASRNELPGPKTAISEYTGMLGTMRWVIVEGHATISTLANLVTGKTNTATRKILVDAPNKANNKRKALYKGFLTHFRRLADRAGIAWSDVAKLNDTTRIIIGGKEFDVTYDDLLSLYAHIQADDNLIRILTTEGLNFYTYETIGGIFRKRHINEVGTPTLAELREVAALVPQAHKKLLTVHFQTNRDVQAPSINQMSMQTENYEKAVYNKYWHVSRQMERIPEGKRTDLSVSAEAWGRFKNRTGGKQRINIRSFSQEVILGMQMDAAYATMTTVMEDARTLLGNKSWRRKAKDAGHRRALNELVVMFRRAQGLISDQSIIDMTAANILSSAGKSILSARPSGMGVQIASVPAAHKVVNAKYFLKAETPSLKEINELMERSPVLWLRWKGKQFDYALGAVGAHKAFQGMLFDHTDKIDKLLSPYLWGDQIAIWKIWKAAGRQVADRGNITEGTTEHEEATLELLYDALETQPQWDMMHRSPITSSPSAWVRGMTMFMSARNAQYQVLLQAVDDVQKGRITQRQATERIGSIGMSAAMVSISKRTFRLAVKGAAITTLVAIGVIDRPEEEAIEEGLKELKKIPRETVFNLMGLNALGSLFTAIGYGAISRITYGPMQYSEKRSGNMLADIMFDVMNAGELYALTAYQAATMEKYKSGPKKGQYKATYSALAAADQTAQLIAYRFGLPYEGPKADIVWPVKSVTPKED